MASDPARDRTKDYDYQRLIEEEKHHYSSIEVTDRLLEGGLHSGGCWMRYWQRVHARLSSTPFGNIVEVLEDRTGRPDRPLRVLSLGAGYCGHELDLARRFQRPYEIHCLDINTDLFSRAREVARDESLNLHFHAADLNFVELEADSWDLVHANAAVHHVINLEWLFEQIARGLRPDGLFHIVEVLGRNRRLLWEENECFANGLLELLPKTVVGPARVHVTESGGMEGVRQEEIEGLLGQHFALIFELRHGAFARFLCTDPTLAPQLDPADPERRAWLDFLFDADDAAVRRGLLRPLELWGIYEAARA